MIFHRGIAVDNHFNNLGGLTRRECDSACREGIIFACCRSTIGSFIINGHFIHIRIGQGNDNFEHGRAGIGFELADVRDTDCRRNNFKGTNIAGCIGGPCGTTLVDGDAIGIVAGINRPAACQ